MNDKQIAVITGCSSGIGRALANTFKSSGYIVYACARKLEDVNTLNESGFIGIQLDVNNEEQIKELGNRITKEHNRLDVLINSAGYGAMGPLLDGGVDALRRQFDTNVFSHVALTRALFPALRANNGLVVNIGSISGVLVSPFAGAYCASKAAVHAISNAMRMELSPFNIDVMEVQPGAISSNFGVNATKEADSLISKDSPWYPVRDGIIARAHASQDNPTPADIFATKLLEAVKRNPRPRLLRLGNGSFILPFMAKYLPQGLIEKSLKKRFGLNVKL